MVPHHPKSAGGSLSSSQNRAILITTLTCSSLSFCIVLYALRIFIIKRRSFRHRLVMHLILSNTLKAGLYFVFPIVVFARGPVQSSSTWCQASGFLLEFGIEAADMSILIIALHSMVYVLRPNMNSGEGGLYSCRNWIYLFWLGPPLLAASLAFIKGGHGYVTAGTFCYLPKRPYWYRLALSWVPRYLIIGVIVVMYIWLYVYVHIRFRGFGNIDLSDTSHGSSWDSRRKSSTRPIDMEKNLTGVSARQMRIRSQDLSFQQVPPSGQLEPWDYVEFITTQSLPSRVPTADADGENLPCTARGCSWSGDTQTPVGDGSVRAGIPNSSWAESGKTSRVPATMPSHAPNLLQPVATSDVVNDPLRQTRIAIRKQLRYMFVYPAVYVVMWSFPFAQHALNYNDYYVEHPVFWLNLVTALVYHFLLDGKVSPNRRLLVAGEPGMDMAAHQDLFTAFRAVSTTTERCAMAGSEFFFRYNVTGGFTHPVQEPRKASKNPAFND
ncbi:hypothetical protein A1O3_05303 [Capronia epimyces CBS 606.96]|uniref:G-protein coupled receptors family 2 profile 2 domain-containing protein n=1 Tax=Capronia epimyces CBS 606.96 TaxID=1182542 RepID=W9XWL8_9EURO|nr:uncharacterized protein A1O3_05303 [Capronia epimyces CBS 606.96]EXJ84633.1 hypothetical protein A1O3_05303 [Capronia epimyces CBS 606.96]